MLVPSRTLRMHGVTAWAATCATRARMQTGLLPATLRPACILTLSVSRGCIDVCEAALAKAPASTSCRGLSAGAGGGLGVLLPELGRAGLPPVPDDDRFLSCSHKRVF